MDVNVNVNRQRIAKTEWIYILLGAVLSLGFFFRHFLFSLGDRIFGDLGDPRIVLVLLEHWWQWWKGMAPWPSPGFFWPVTGVLGYTDAYFLFSLPYILIRQLGGDPYIAMECSLIAMKLAGYGGMVWFLWRIFRLPVIWAVFGGILFTILNAGYWHVLHMQLSVVALMPWLFGLAWLWLETGQPVKLAVILAALWAALFLTSFYIAWFAVLYLPVFLIGLWIAGPERFQWKPRWMVRTVPAAGVFVLGMLPFFYIYLPMLKERGGHAYSIVLDQMLFPAEIARVGPDNWLWGWMEPFFDQAITPFLFERTWTFISHYERMSGFTPVLLLFFTAVALGVIWNTLGRRKTAVGPLVFIALAVGGWLISSRYGNLGNFSPWYVIYEYLPGGKAMRVPSRMPLFLSVFLVPVVVWGLSVLLSVLTWRRMAIVLAGCILIEQVNFAPVTEISRQAEMKRLDFVPPPAGCKAFFVTGSTPVHTGYSLLDGFYVPNIDAMILSSRWNIPTLNGISTWFPRGWRLTHPGQPAYLAAAGDWVRRAGADASVVCSLDLARGVWSFPSITLPAIPVLGHAGLTTTSLGTGVSVLRKGWFEPETWGVWTEGNEAELEFIPARAGKLCLDFQAFQAETHPMTVSLKMNGMNGMSGTLAETWRIDASSRQVRCMKTPVPVQGAPLTLKLSIDTPRSPAQLGISPDSRAIGLGLIALYLHELT